MHRDRLPPGQQLAAIAKWPVVGEREPAPGNRWPLQITGLVSTPLSFTLEDLRALPQTELVTDIHCVTRWTKLDMQFRGVLLSTLFELARPRDDAAYVSFIAHSTRRHSTSLPIADALSLGVIIALEAEGRALGVEHGGPIRAITPGRYFYKSVKWLSEIELRCEDQLGYWEGSAGYHNHADPWREERFIASGITKQDAARIFETRDISDCNLLGLDGSDRNLAGLVARGSLLRNANFRRANLAGACFDRANLSNAQFIDANLQRASFQGADLEGANLIGSDLRETNLLGASLFGALFIDPETQVAAKLDRSTRIDTDALEALTPLQAQFVHSSRNA